MDRWRRPCPEPVPPNDDGLRNTRSREALHRSDHDAPQGSIASSLVGDRQSGGPPSRACIELGVRKTPETGSGSSGTKGASREASAAILPFRIDPFSLGTVACTAMNCSVALCKILVQLRDPAGSGDRDRHSLGPNHQAGLEAGAVRSEISATVPARLTLGVRHGGSRPNAPEATLGHLRPVRQSQAAGRAAKSGSKPAVSSRGIQKALHRSALIVAGAWPSTTPRALSPSANSLQLEIESNSIGLESHKRLRESRSCSSAPPRSEDPSSKCLKSVHHVGSWMAEGLRSRRERPKRATDLPKM